MPAQRPGSGYPYAVVNGASFPAQEPGAHPTPDDFLTNAGGGVANVVNHPGGYSLRVSDDNNMAIEDSDLNQRQPKAFYATQEVINNANTELQRVGSAFRLQPGAQNLSILTNWWGTRNLIEATPVYNGGNANNAPQNCDEMACRVAGTPGNFTATSFSAGEEAARGIGGISATEWNRRRNLRRYNDDGDREYVYTVADLENYQAQQYVLNRDNEEVRRRQANQYAQPGVGDAFMIASIGPGTPQANGQTRIWDIVSGQNRDVNWRYHFAGVVARSGNDRITLENYARGDDRVANADPRWYFQMYGTGATQSFHEFHSARPEYANPVTLSRTNPNRPAPDPWWQPAWDYFLVGSG